MSKQSVTKQTYKGSVLPSKNFNPEADAAIFYDNLRKEGKDEAKVIELLASRANAQRIEIAKCYNDVYERDLVHDLKSHFYGDFQSLVQGLLQHPAEYDAAWLNKAVKGIGTSEKILVEILVSRTAEAIQKINEVYLQAYDRELIKDIAEDTSGDFKEILLKLASVPRADNSKPVLSDTEDAGMLRNDMKYSNGGKFIEILCTRSFNQLKATFSEYKKMTGSDILDAIKHTFSNDSKDALNTVVQFVEHPPTYFADRLYRSMKGAGTDDSTLIRVVVTRSEIDMVDIKAAFLEKYGKSLEKFIYGDTSGSYRKLLLALVDT